MAEKSLTTNPYGRYVGAAVPQHINVGVQLKKKKKKSPASTGTHLSSDGLRCEEGFEASFWRTSFPLLLLISRHSVIFALAFGECRRTFTPPMQPTSSAFCLPKYFEHSSLKYLCSECLRPPFHVRCCSHWRHNC